MNLRVLKKDIEFFIGEFIDDCALFVAINPGKDSEGISDIIEEAVVVYNELKTKISHPAEGSKKAYYNEIRKEMFEKIDALCEKLSTTITKE